MSGPAHHADHPSGGKCHALHGTGGARRRAADIRCPGHGPGGSRGSTVTLWPLYSSHPLGTVGTLKSHCPCRPSRALWSWRAGLARRRSHRNNRQEENGESGDQGLHGHPTSAPLTTRKAPLWRQSVSVPPPPPRAASRVVKFTPGSVPSDAQFRQFPVVQLVPPVSA